MSTIVVNDRTHKRRSEERCRLDTLTRQLLHKTETFGYYVRLYYLEEDDSFFLEWRLPDLSIGSKYFVNVDDCYYSLRHCLEEIEKHCERSGVFAPVPSVTATVKPLCPANRRVIRNGRREL